MSIKEGTSPRVMSLYMASLSCHLCLTPTHMSLLHCVHHYASKLLLSMTTTFLWLSYHSKPLTPILSGSGMSIECHHFLINDTKNKLLRDRLSLLLSQHRVNFMSATQYLSYTQRRYSSPVNSPHIVHDISGHMDLKHNELVYNTHTNTVMSVHADIERNGVHSIYTRFFSVLGREDRWMNVT